MMDPIALRALIKQTLAPLQLYSANAEELLMATCAQESLLGTFRKQVGGPALGIFQMEPSDHDDIWRNFLQYKPILAIDGRQLVGFVVGTPPAYLLETNDPYAIFMCRMHYDRVPRPLPPCDDLNAIFIYYKVAFNTVQGAATQAEFYEHYKLTGGSAK
jgi:hypothetical protein